MLSKKTAIILILAVFLGTLGALIWFYFTFNDRPDKTPPAPITNVDVYDPFGTQTNNNLPPASTTDIVVDNDDQTNLIPVNKLRKISEEPVSGFIVTTDPKDKKTNIRYILRTNGNIYETYEESLESRRLSNTTVPRVYESVWLPGGQKLIIRYLKDKTENIQTFSVKINPATTTLNEFEGGIDGNFLPENINALALNPLGDKLYYQTSNLNGASGFISSPTGLNKKLLFESPLIEWNISWPKEETITLNTKPSSQIPGYLYFLNSRTGSLTKILGNILGLTTKTNPAANLVLYSDSARGTPRLYLYIIKTGESRLLPWNTLPEKCLWSNTDDKIIYCAVPKNFPSGNYPDVWYQGLVNLTDEIWSLNTETGASVLVSDIEKESNEKIDAIDLQIDENDNYLFFVNKTNLTLWSLNLR